MREWIALTKCGTHTVVYISSHPNSVRPNDRSTHTRLERLQTDLHRSLGRIYMRPSA
jgi:hypothetical protein